MGGHHQSGPPTAYSTRTTYDDTSGFHTDGYRVVIDPDKLQASVDHFKKQLHGQNVRQLLETLNEAMGASDAFGKIPNSDHARTELRRFVESHVEQMRKMSSETLVEFVARVQAAAQLGYDSDPATRAAAARAHAGRMGME